MKFSAFLFLFLALRAHSQSGEYLQPDSVYKLHHVKTRTVKFYNGEESRIVCTFDRNGKLLERIQFDGSGKRFYNRNLYRYNNRDQLTLNTYVTYWYEAGNRLLIDSVPHPTKYWWTNALYYDTLNRLARTVFTNPAGEAVGESTYTYNPFTVHSKGLSPLDGSRSTLTIVYDAPGVERQYNSYTETAGKVTNRWEEVYENTFDDGGKIIKRKQTAPASPGWAMEYVYEYDNKGLLARVISRRVDCTRDCSHVSLVFEYDYWAEDIVSKGIRPWR